MSAGTISPTPPTGLLRPLLHDLRSPLASIMALAHFASSRKPMRDTDVIATLADISAAARHLNELAEIALFVTKASEERSEIDVSAIAFGEMAGSLLLELKSQAVCLGIELNIVEGQAVLHGDGALIKMLLRSMIKSAVKYSRSNDRVTIFTRCQQLPATQRHEVGVEFNLPQGRSYAVASPAAADFSGAFTGDGFFQMNLTTLFGSAVADSHCGDFFVVNDGHAVRLMLSIPASVSASLSQASAALV